DAPRLPTVEVYGPPRPLRVRSNCLHKSNTPIERASCRCPLLDVSGCDCPEAANGGRTTLAACERCPAWEAD
ncbi:MAG: hypothetical protein ACRDD1_17930, partial [Planctomycetia bacterium]